jgi:hypothetical protein
MYAFHPKGKKLHTLLLDAICWGIWNVRNRITFDHLVVRSSLVTIASMCTFLKFWAGLYVTKDGNRIRLGAEQLLHQASC